MKFKVEFKTRWSDFDSNIHMRHTAYNDYAAEARMRLFNEFGITIKDFAKEKIGPVLFEENTSYRKEVHLGEDITVTVKLHGFSKDGERWKVQHEILNGKGQISAIINVHGAWIDLEKRKLTSPSEKCKEVFVQLDKTEGYEEIILKKK